MKRYIRSQETIEPTVVEVIFDIELKANDSEVAAATYKGYEIPEGELPPADKNAIVHTQIWQEYQDVIEIIEEIIEDHNLNIYYKNKSDYNSFYWSALAKDDKGNDLFDFTVRIRVSTHDAHRTKQSQQNKKEEKAALAKLTQKRSIGTLSITATVNNKSTEFKSYLDVIAYIYEEVDNALEIMTRRSKKYPKKD